MQDFVSALFFLFFEADFASFFIFFFQLTHSMHTKNPENFFSGLYISGSEFFFFIAIHLACYL